MAMVGVFASLLSSASLAESMSTMAISSTHKYTSFKEAEKETCFLVSFTKLAPPIGLIWFFFLKKEKTIYDIVIR